MTTEPERAPELSDAEIAEIEARAAAATEGPWEADGSEIYDAAGDWVGESLDLDAPDGGETNARFAAAARTDVPRLVAALRAAREERDQAQADLALATEFTICGHPNPASINAESYMVQVAYRDVNRWAVIHHGYCLDAAGNWEYESRPSERRDEWLATHRFSLPDAMRLARQAAPLLSINGMTGPQCHEWELSRMESADV